MNLFCFASLPTGPAALFHAASVPRGIHLLAAVAFPMVEQQRFILEGSSVEFTLGDCASIKLPYRRAMEW